MNTVLMISLFLILLTSANKGHASGIDQEPEAKRVSIDFIQGISVYAELGPDGLVESMRLKFHGREVVLGQEDIGRFKNVNLQTINVRISDPGPDGALRLTEVSVLYGESVKALSPDGRAVYMNPTVAFLFSGDRLVARYRAEPIDGEVKWNTFCKLPGKDQAEEHTGIREGEKNPYRLAR